MTTALVPYGVSRNSYARRVVWAERKAGLRPMPPMPTPTHRRAHCARGHLYRPGSYWLRARDGWRRCKTCRLIKRGRKRFVATRARLRLEAAKTRLVKVGIRMHREPLSMYWRCRYEAALKLYRAASDEMVRGTQRGGT